MAWRKSPQSLIDAFMAAIPMEPGVEPRQMFGYPCAFVNGLLFTGLHQENWMVRLPEDLRRRFIEEHGATVFEPMAGRPMREYLNMPAAILADERARNEWVRLSLAFARTLPPKGAKRAVNDSAGRASAPKKSAPKKNAAKKSTARTGAGRKPQ